MFSGCATSLLVAGFWGDTSPPYKNVTPQLFMVWSTLYSHLPLLSLPFIQYLNFENELKQKCQDHPDHEMRFQFDFSLYCISGRNQYQKSETCSHFRLQIIMLVHETSNCLQVVIAVLQTVIVIPVVLYYSTTVLKFNKSHILPDMERYLKESASPIQIQVG